MEPRTDDLLDDDTVLQAVSVFGARVRGESVAADTPALADELQRRWEAEGHAPGSRFAPDSVPGRVVGWARAGVARLPDRWQQRLRRVVHAVRSRVRRS